MELDEDQKPGVRYGIAPKVAPSITKKAQTIAGGDRELLEAYLTVGFRREEAIQLICHNILKGY